MLPLRAGITPVGALPFRRAVAGQLLDTLCPEGLGDGCAVLRCGGSGEETARGLLPVLSSRARYVRLEGEGTASLARELMYRWGIAAGDGGRAAAVTVLCGEGCRAPGVDSPTGRGCGGGSDGGAGRCAAGGGEMGGIGHSYHILA